MRRKQEVRASGGCLCGAVSYRVLGPLRGVVNCHCGQCRRTHGHFAPYSRCARGEEEMVEDRGLRWYESSAQARRGFCAECGASLFWDGRGRDTMGLAAGTLDPPTGLNTIRHFHTAGRGDYYEVAVDAPRFEGTAPGPAAGA